MERKTPPRNQTPQVGCIHNTFQYDMGRFCNLLGNDGHPHRWPAGNEVVGHPICVGRPLHNAWPVCLRREVEGEDLLWSHKSAVFDHCGSFQPNGKIHEFADDNRFVSRAKDRRLRDHHFRSCSDWRADAILAIRFAWRGPIFLSLLRPDPECQGRLRSHTPCSTI